MPRLRIDEANGLTVADITHIRFSALPADATVGDVRAWFAQSTSRRLAFIADGERYVGSLTPADVAADVDPRRPAAEVAQDGPTVSPAAPATTGRDLALLSDARPRAAVRRAPRAGGRRRRAPAGRRRGDRRPAVLLRDRQLDPMDGCRPSGCGVRVGTRA